MLKIFDVSSFVLFSVFTIWWYGRYLFSPHGGGNQALFPSEPDVEEPLDKQFHSVLCFLLIELVHQRIAPTDDDYGFCPQSTQGVHSLQVSEH